MARQEWARIAKRDKMQQRLSAWINEETQAAIKTLSEDELGKQLEAIIAAPISFAAANWYDWTTVQNVTEEIALFERITLPRDAHVLEVATGSQTSVPLAVECYTEGNGRYTTANLNKELTRAFLEAAKKLTIVLNVVEDDAVNLPDYYPEAIFDAAIFQHAVNDILQGIVAEQIGIDTAKNDWFAILPAMIAEMAKRHRDGTLEATAKPEFLHLMEAVTKTVKPGGILFFTHWEYEDDLAMGYPPELYSNFIALARKWITDANLPLTEVHMTGFDAAYRLILRKTL